MAKLNPAAVAGGGLHLKSALVAGAAADTNIAVTGLSWAKDPKFVACIRLEGSATYAAPADLQAEVKRGTTDGSIQLETTVTTGDHLLLLWLQDD
jgi:hypothetical protein